MPEFHPLLTRKWLLAQKTKQASEAFNICRRSGESVVTNPDFTDPIKVATRPRADAKPNHAANEGPR